MWIKKRSERSSKADRSGRLRVTSEFMPGPLKEYETLLTKSCAGNDQDSVPAAAVISANGKGKILHSFAAGTSTTRVSSTSAGTSGSREDIQTKDVPFTADTVCWIASCTKVMATVAAMQCVERGLISLDAPIDAILPELKSSQILLNVNGEKNATFKPATKNITLRHLLTHSSGLSYEFTHPKMYAWRRWFNRQSKQNLEMTKSTKAEVAYQAPLLFEPGGGWAYSTGIDWAGVAVERVTGLSLEDYMRKNIWDPLGMSCTSFYPERHPHMSSRLSSMAVRDDEGNIERGAPNPLQAYLNVKESGGGACFSTANDYIKFLSALTAPTCPLLKTETIELMFSATHLSGASNKSLLGTHSSPLAFGLAGNLPIGTNLSYGLGGILNLDPIRSTDMDPAWSTSLHQEKGTGRSAGGMQWSGLPNLFWWVNRKDGICGCYFSQLLPTGDRRSSALYEGYEGAVMREYGLGTWGHGKL